MDVFLTTIPTIWLGIIGFILGSIVGSFLNVFTYRLHTGKSINGRSHCLSCARPLEPYELFPLISYLCLRARCRTCGSHIPTRYFLVEMLTAVLFTGVLLTQTHVFTVLALFFVMSVLITILVYDFQHFVIPDELTLALTVGVFVFEGILLSTGLPLLTLGYNVIAASLGSTFFFVLWAMSKGKWIGFGDVKLAFPLGVLVGAEFVFTFIVLSFWVGAAVSLILIWLAMMSRGKHHLQLPWTRLTMKSAVPFAPFLIAGCLVTFFMHFNVLSLFSF